MKKAPILLAAALGCTLLFQVPVLYGSEVDPAPERRWTILIAGNPAGTQTLRLAASGEHIYTLQYNDRGRGPQLETRLTLGRDAIPRRIETSGSDYLKAPVEERYSLRGKRARWKNKAGEGRKTLATPAFYVSQEGAHPELALLARALLRARHKRLPLVPDGEASLRIIGKHVVEAGGRTRTLTQVAISGLNFFPNTVWLDEENAFFGVNYSWFTIVPEGAEASGEKLLAADRDFRATWFADLARRLSHKPERGVAFMGVGVFDPRTGKVAENSTVVVLGDRIDAVGPDGTVPMPAGVEIIDARDKLLLPGLWDMHAHVEDIDGVLNIAAGVTTVRDLANSIDEVLALKQKWKEGEAIGPRLILAGGFMDGPGPYAGPTKILVDTKEEALAAVDRYADLGYEQIKIYSSIRPAVVPAIIERAHERGLKISGHIPNGMTAEQAVHLGLDEIQHINMLFLNFWGAEGIDTRTPARFTAVAERAAGLDLDSKEVSTFVQLLKERKVIVDPTVTVFETMFTAPPRSLSANFAAIPYELPLQARLNAWGRGLQPPEGMADTYRESHAAMLRLVKKLYDAGVPLVAGTDDLPGFTLHRELELYVKAGIPASEVLRLATLGAARLTGRGEELGSIEPGKLADLILVDGNPTENISDIRKVELTVRGGVLHRSAELYAAVAVEGP
jgi:imidazolonepropionase-like amidohydrolase